MIAQPDLYQITIHSVLMGNYRQTKGMEMGIKFAPVYATLVIGYLEEILYEKTNAKYGK